MGGLGPFERQKTKPGEHEMLGMSREGDDLGPISIKI